MPSLKRSPLYLGCQRKRGRYEERERAGSKEERESEDYFSLSKKLSFFPSIPSIL